METTQTTWAGRRFRLVIGVAVLAVALIAVLMLSGDGNFTNAQRARNDVGLITGAAPAGRSACPPAGCVTPR
ncbi:MAG: hypothetical protein NTZ05_07855 [Chloroflexi bacterium]|nr:hypothetical protein [Chloroflexota bacterium]